MNKDSALKIIESVLDIGWLALVFLSTICAVDDFKAGDINEGLAYMSYVVFAGVSKIVEIEMLLNRKLKRDKFKIVDDMHEADK